MTLTKFSNLKFLYFVVIATTLLSCRTAEFADSKRRKPLDKYTQPVIVDCLKENESNFDLPITGNAETKLIVQGKVCPNMEDIFEKKTILVLVDQSGSMKVNDPVVGGTCSRLEAIRALVDKVRSTEKAPDNVFVGIIGFDTNARVLSPPTQVSNIGTYLNVSPICDYSGYTNYEHAFDTASNLIRSVDGSKNVYFISDGLPRVPDGVGAVKNRSDTVVNSALAASYDLRSIPGTELFILYLQDKSGASEGEVTNPEDYLKTLAGDPAKVKVVVEARRLVDEILKFDVKPAPKIAVLNPKIFLESPGQPTREIMLASIEPDLSTDSVWVYESETFKPYSSRDGQTLNKVVIQMTDDNGRLFRSTVNVLFSYPSN